MQQRVQQKVQQKVQQNHLVIHAGSHKTGSSAIQRYLFDNQSCLGATRYLNRGKPNASPWMLQAFKHDFAALPAFRHRQLGAVKSTAMRERARALLAEQSAQSTAPLCILSAEAIGTLNGEELRALHDCVAPFFSRVSLHQYFRPLKSRMESAFQEKLKHGATTLKQKFPLAYIHTLELQDGVFGADNVKSYKYDSGQFPEGDVVLHFLQQMGIEPVSDGAAAAVNEGLSLPAIQLLYVYRMFYPSQAARDRRVVARLKQLNGKPLRFHSELYNELIVLTPEEEARFEERAGFSIAENQQADDDIAIRCEQDLLAIPDRSVAWLYAQSDSGQAMAQPDLQGIASLVALLGVQAP